MKALRIRARIAKILRGLSCDTTRARLLAVLVRTAPDCMLPKLSRLARAERRAQSRIETLRATAQAPIPAAR